MIELALAESLAGDPRGCWANSERLGEMFGCKDRPTDDLGLCAYHRAKLFENEKEPT